jgi:hypothetical protein
MMYGEGWNLEEIGREGAALVVVEAGSGVVWGLPRSPSRW